MEKDKRVHVKNVSFIKSAVKPVQYPPAEMPEIAFVGRSNVGKSSLVNLLVNRKNLVRTSNTPGRTQLINFFCVNEEFMLVDLPGYGFAKVPLSVKKEWGPMIEAYLSKRETLRGVVLILDVRREPSTEDILMLDQLRSHGIHPVLVITKCDKVSKNERKRQTQIISRAMQVQEADFLYFSALSREGVHEIWGALEPLVAIHSD